MIRKNLFLQLAFAKETCFSNKPLDILNHYNPKIKLNFFLFLCVQEKQFISFSTSTHYRWRSTRLFRHYTRWRSCCLFSWLKRLVAIFFTKKNESAVWILMCSMLHSEEWSQVYPYWGENWKMTVNNKNLSPQREYCNVGFVLYTMRCVWLIIDNFDNIRTNTTDQSQLTVGLWPIFEPLGTPRNTCTA